MYKYKQLNDYDWLKQKYLIENWSAKKISKFIGCKSENSVRQALIRFNIKIRNRSDAQVFLNPVVVDNKSIIDGHLLGDGHLSIYNKKSDICCPSFQQKSIHKEYIDYIGNQLLPQHYQDKITYHTYTLSVNQKQYSFYQFTSYSNQLLRNYWERWYPESNNFVKLVPKNVKLDNVSILNWFMDDGSTYYRKRKYQSKRINQIKLTLCSQSFTKDDNEFLVETINQKYNLGLTFKKHKKNQYLINVKQKYTDDFLDFIGESPVQCMKYKWKRRSIS